VAGRYRLAQWARILHVKEVTGQQIIRTHFSLANIILCEDKADGICTDDAGIVLVFRWHPYTHQATRLIEEA
jgi:hypothetical protein